MADEQKNEGELREARAILEKAYQNMEDIRGWLANVDRDYQRYGNVPTMEDFRKSKQVFRDNFKNVRDRINSMMDSGGSLY